MAEVVKDNLSSASILAVSVIEGLLKNPNTQDAVKLKAAVSVLELSGYKAPQQIEMKIQDTSDDELDSKLSSLLKKSGSIIDAEVLDSAGV